MRYYLLHRPPGLGHMPMSEEELGGAVYVGCEAWETRRPVPGAPFEAWGWVDYDRPLDAGLARRYELEAVAGAPVGPRGSAGNPWDGFVERVEALSGRWLVLVPAGAGEGRPQPGDAVTVVFPGPRGRRLGRRLGCEAVEGFWELSKEA